MLTNQTIYASINIVFPIKFTNNQIVNPKLKNIIIKTNRPQLFLQYSRLYINNT